MRTTVPSPQPVLSYRTPESDRLFIESSDVLIQLPQVPLGMQFIAPSMLLLACAAGVFACLLGALALLRDRLIPAFVIIIPLLFALGFLLGSQGVLQYIRTLARAGNKPLLLDIGRTRLRILDPRAMDPKLQLSADLIESVFVIKAGSTVTLARKWALCIRTREIPGVNWAGTRMYHFISDECVVADLYQSFQNQGYVAHRHA